ncbi:MAG: four helix bundle protein [Sphingobacteriaceae bacterium]|nr:MAG: four helix bundle protein [Sphingobacteriaceae bacterium]
MQNYNELKVWDKAHQLTLKVYQLTKFFPKEEVYGLTSQVRRSAASIPANIAEGCGKNSQLELAHYLNTSLGSANETEYHLLLAKDLSYFLVADHDILAQQINKIKAMLISLITKVREV